MGKSSVVQQTPAPQSFNMGMDPLIAKSENFQQTNPAIVTTRIGADKCWLSFGHAEIESMKPAQERWVFDGEWVLAPADAKNVIAQLMKFLETIGAMQKKPDQGGQEVQ